MDTWKFFAGLGLFLYGMKLMEHVLKSISGRSFKLFLKEYTQSLFKSITGGALITGLVQSSSVVSLLVLAFVETGTITLRNALGVILGSNLGTTLTSWIVATIGFKLDVENFSLPIVGISAIAMFFLQEQKKLYDIARLFFAFGILFLGLGFMKSAAELFVKDIDLSTYSQYGLWVFVLIGFGITILIQSSSATVAVTLTALNSQVLSFPLACAVVIGSELGTTIKIVLAGSKGTSDKKRVAWGNFAFNLITCAISLIFLPGIIFFIQEVVKLHDPLIGLVFLQTMINFFSIFLFLPFIDIFANWLNKRFKGNIHQAASFISRSLPVVPELAVEALSREGENLLKKTVDFHNFVLNLEQPPVTEGFLRSLGKSQDSLNGMYGRLKQTEGSILEYYTRLQTADLSQEQYALINQYITTVRFCIRAAKSMKDIYHDLEDLESTADETLYKQYHDLQKDWKEFHQTFLSLLEIEDKKTLFEELASVMKRAFQNQKLRSSEIIESLRKKHLNEIETSTLMNVHHEILSVKKSLLRALAHLKLTAAQADEFEFLPES
jgi:phosphate:Na+ symporter